MSKMKLSEFNFNLPDELIAEYPTNNRDDSKLMVVHRESGKIEHDDWKWSTIEDIKEIENTEIPIYLLEKALEISKNETTN